MAHEEYLRRNLIHCGSVGAVANVEAALARLAMTKRPPKWLVTALEGIAARIAPLPPIIAKYRNAANDAPSYMKARDGKDTFR